MASQGGDSRAEFSQARGVADAVTQRSSGVRGGNWRWLGGALETEGSVGLPEG